jgi:hypothetical protein
MCNNQLAYLGSASLPPHCRQMATRLPPTACISIPHYHSLSSRIHLVTLLVTTQHRPLQTLATTTMYEASFIIACLSWQRNEKPFPLFSTDEPVTQQNQHRVSVNTHNPLHCITRFVKTLAYLIWNGHARDTRPPILPGKRTKLPKQTTESKGYDYRINKGSSWQLGALFFLRMETRILPRHPHWWGMLLHFLVYRCPTNILRKHKKTSKYNTDITTPKM